MDSSSRAIPEDAYPDLYVLLAAYFNQDWDMDAPDWEGIVARFTAAESHTRVRAAAADIGRLLASVPDDDRVLRGLASELGCYYDPRPDLPDGMSHRDWLERVRAQLLAALRPVV